jgi:ribonuclease P protein component
MLAKKFRLPIEKSSLLKRQRSYKGTYFSLKRISNDLPYSRFGVVVSKKVDKRATRRNNIKRFIFNFIRKSNSHLRPGSDFLFYSQKPIDNKE